MTEKQTEYGRLTVGTKEELFRRAIDLVVARQGNSESFTWALTGGNTPQEWYRWCVANNALSASLVAKAHFTVSDERCVPFASDQSNFGNASRLLLDPLGIAAERRHPWDTTIEPVAAVENYGKRWESLGGAGRTYDVCFLGMGDDAHTASIFPGSPLLVGCQPQLFSHVDVPGKGMRLTITPAGLRAAGMVVVMALGATKTAALQRVFTAPYNPAEVPSQLLKACADRVVWLVDQPAAGDLMFA